MIPRLLVIRSSGKVHRFLVTSRRFTIGTSPGNNLLLCHGFFRDRELIVQEGQIMERVAGPGAGGDESLTKHGPRFKTEGLLLELLDLPWRRGLLAAICLAAALSGLFYSAAKTADPQDWAPLTLPAEGPFGMCRQDRAHPKGVRFSLTSQQGGGSMLSFIPGGLGSGLRLEVTIDGLRVGEPIAVPRGWGERANFSIPAPDNEGEERLLEIRPFQAGGDTEPWGVKDVRLEQDDHIVEAPYPALDLLSLEATLADPFTDGPSLARCYRILVSRPQETFPDQEERSRELEEELASRIMGVIRKEQLRIRSLKDLGRDEEAWVLRKFLQSWVPVSGWLMQEGAEGPGGRQDG